MKGGDTGSFKHNCTNILTSTRQPLKAIFIFHSHPHSHPHTIIGVLVSLTLASSRVCIPSGGKKFSHLAKFSLLLFTSQYTVNYEDDLSEGLIYRKGSGCKRK